MRSSPPAVDSSTHRPQAAAYENVIHDIQRIGMRNMAAATPVDIPENDEARAFKIRPMIMIAVNPSDKYAQRTTVSERQGSVNTPEKNVQRGSGGMASCRISPSR